MCSIAVETLQFASHVTSVCAITACLLQGGPKNWTVLKKFIIITYVGPMRGRIKMIYILKRSVLHQEYERCFMFITVKYSLH